MLNRSQFVYKKIDICQNEWVSSSLRLTNMRVKLAQPQFQIGLVLLGLILIFYASPNLLYHHHNEQKHDFEREVDELNDSSSCLLMSSINRRRPACQLLHYTTQRVVDCLDSLHHQDDSSSSSIHHYSPDNKGLLHFVFMGDSRIRQQFLNFIKVETYSFPAS